MPDGLGSVKGGFPEVVARRVAGEHASSFAGVKCPARNGRRRGQSTNTMKAAVAMKARLIVAA